MKKTAKKYSMENIKNYWAGITIVTGTLFLFSIKDLFSFLTSQQFAGRDLVGNYAFTHLMKQNLMQGEVFSWTNQWLLGFPSFELYPPFFFLTTSLLDLLTGQLLGLQFWFKIVVFSSVFLTPLITYFAFQKVFEKEKAFFAGFYALLFLFVYTPVSQIYQVFSVGMVAQGFSFLLLTVSIGFMMRDGRRNKIISGVLLGFVSLSHPFVGFVGFLLSASLVVTTRDVVNLIPGAIGGIIFAPWLLNAAKYLPYTSSFTFQPANTGIFLYMLLPMIILGGYQGRKCKALLITFFSLLAISVIELPLVTQELRFYTYSLGIGSILAGFGAFKTSNYISQEFKIDRKVIAAILLIPVIGLSLQTDLPKSWEFEGDAEPLYEELEENEKGRVLVETSNSSIFSSFVLQEKIPIETKHWAVNEVHMDSSTSANYILTLESWISKEPLYNPICRTCNTSASPSLIDRRLDDLGIRYVVAKTPESRDLLREFMSYEGRHGDYWLFENKEGYQLVEPLRNKPVALVGEYSKWKSVNDILFTKNTSKEIIWTKNYPDSSYAKTVYMKNLSAKQVIERLEQIETEPIQENNFSTAHSDRNLHISTLVPLKAKFSYFPSENPNRKAGKFNSIFIEPGSSIRLGTSKRH